MFATIMGMFGAYVALRVFGNLNLPVFLWVLFGVLALALSQNYPLTKLVYGNMFALELPRPLVIAVNLGFAAVMFMGVMHLVVDLLNLLWALVRWQRPALPSGVSWAVVGLAVGLAALGVTNAIRQPALKEMTVEIRDLPAQFEGYSFVHLTDIHLSRIFNAGFAQTLVERVNALSPEAIVISGDLIDGYIEDRRADVAPLAGLSAPDGVFVSPGNHEYYFDFPTYWAHYQTLGMRPLANAHEVIRREGAQLVIAGVTDPSARRFGLPVPDIDAALAGAPAEAPVILLNHQPVRAAQMAERGVDLHLAGHTHGGMVAGLSTLVARSNAGFVSGRYQVGDMLLYVNNGTALWPGFAVRLGVPSELTKITLQRAPAV